MGKTPGVLTMRPTSLTALTDQADAATRHQADMFSAAADRTGGTVRHDALPEHGQRMRRILGDGLMSGRTGFCEHLSPLAPQPAYWVPCAPGTVRCARCAGDLVRLLRGTNYARICDDCGKYVRSLELFAFALPAKVVDLSGLAAFPGAVCPPISISYGLCSGCLSGQDSTATASPNPL